MLGLTKKVFFLFAVFLFLPRIVWGAQDYVYLPLEEKAFKWSLEADDLKALTKTPSKPQSIYNRPYSLWENEVNSKLLKRNTIALFGTGVAVMGFLYMMPSSFTNWEDDGESPFEKWWDNVSREPVWDKDDFFLNYVTHPYSGALYYMGARSAGANAAYSFLYSFMLSTFFWEYGIESFAERPSIQDLIVTPVAGAILGEGFYLAKRRILENDGCLMDSKALGTTALFLMDPITQIGDLIWDDETAQKFSVSSQPMISKSGSWGYGLSFSYSF